MNSKYGRRAHALKSVAQKRTVNHVVNLNTLVRVYLLDGSSKVLQMFENSTAKDVLLALKFNLDLHDISTYALFRVLGYNVRRVDLSEMVVDALRDPTESGQEVRLLFRSWITFKYGVYDYEVFQYGVRIKQPSTALWLAFMEATFMTMTGQFYLTEDESILLGCLKTQAESGDFNPVIHSVENIKIKVSTRFPEPVRSKMKGLCSPTLGGSRTAEELASRILGMYARLAGKSKVDAQLDYLDCLRTWCPFYGSTFYEVQCQYDDNPLDINSTPPVIAMNASIGPLAIFLITQTDPPVIMRHSYKRIIKWVTHADKHIFTYWVIKPQISISQIEEYQEEHNGEDVDTRQFCDCVYLVTSQVREVEYLVKSYIEAITDISPRLPGGEGDLLPPNKLGIQSEREENRIISSDDKLDEDNEGDDQEKPPRRRLSVFFNALGGVELASQNVSTGSGLASRASENSSEIFGDDTAAVGNSFFRGMYKSSSAKKTKRGSFVLQGNPDLDEDASLSRIPANVTYAASMSELKRLAEEAEFSDKEVDDESDDEDDSDIMTDPPRRIQPQMETGIPANAFRRASRILFGGLNTPIGGNKNSTVANIFSGKLEESDSSDDD